MTEPIVQTPQIDVQTKLLLDLLPVGAAVIAPDLSICYWNQTLVEWTGIPRIDACGKSLPDLFPNTVDARYHDRLQQVFESGTPATYSAALHRHFLPVQARHGLTDQLMIQQTEVRLMSNAPPTALITIQDVSVQYWQLEQLKQERLQLVQARDELESANDKLKQINTELDEFTYVASHDLQEPLRSIKFFGQLLQASLSDDLSTEVVQSLEFIIDASQRMSRLIKDLLNLSKTGRAAMEQQPVDLNRCAEDALNALQVRIQESAAVIHRDPLPTVVGDRRLLTQLYQNLVGNALKFVETGPPEIQLTAHMEDGQWVLGVRDNGIGMEPRFAEQIFAPFRRLHVVDEFQGTGIGLAICKKTIKRHGGRIWVESEPGCGAHFRFTLPVPQTSSIDGPAKATVDDPSVCVPLAADSTASDG